MERGAHIASLEWGVEFMITARTSAGHFCAAGWSITVWPRMEWSGHQRCGAESWPASRSCIAATAATMGQIRSPDPKTSPVHETGASPRSYVPTAGLRQCNMIGETLALSHRSSLDLGCKEKDRLAAVSPKSGWPCVQAAARLSEAVRFLRHQPRTPPLARIRPGRPAPTIGPGTAA